MWRHAESCVWETRTGKEKFPTVAWKVTVNHRGWIMVVSKGYYGSYNDKTIVKYDKLITDIPEKKA